MLKFLDGDQAHAQSTYDVLQLVAGLCQKQRQAGRKVTMDAILALPNFRLPSQGDYRFVLNTGNTDGSVAVFNGKVSYIDWIATIRHAEVIVQGVDMFPTYTQAKLGMDAVAVAV